MNAESVNKALFTLSALFLALFFWQYLQAVFKTGLV